MVEVFRLVHWCKIPAISQQIPANRSIANAHRFLTIPKMNPGVTRTSRQPISFANRGEETQRNVAMSGIRTIHVALFIACLLALDLQAQTHSYTVSTKRWIDYYQRFDSSTTTDDYPSLALDVGYDLSMGTHLGPTLGIEYVIPGNPVAVSVVAGPAIWGGAATYGASAEWFFSEAVKSDVLRTPVDGHASEWGRLFLNALAAGVASHTAQTSGSSQTYNQIKRDMVYVPGESRNRWALRGGYQYEELDHVSPSLEHGLLHVGLARWWTSYWRGMTVLKQEDTTRTSQIDYFKLYADLLKGVGTKRADREGERLGHVCVCTGIRGDQWQVCQAAIIHD